MGSDINHPDPYNHRLLSFVKSSIRVGASIGGLLTLTTPVVAIIILAAGYGIAEVVGIYEELV